MNEKIEKKNRRFLAIAQHTWAAGDTIDEIKQIFSVDFKDCIVYAIEPPCPTWVDGLGRVMMNKAEGEKEFSKYFPVFDLRKRATKKYTTSTKELYKSESSKIDSGSTFLLD